MDQRHYSITPLCWQDALIIPLIVIPCISHYIFTLVQLITIIDVSLTAVQLVVLTITVTLTSQLASPLRYPIMALLVRGKHFTINVNITVTIGVIISHGKNVVSPSLSKNKFSCANVYYDMDDKFY